MQQEEADDPPDDMKRFHVELFIVHPTWNPAQISSALGLEAHGAHGVGEPRVTPRGKALSGTYPDTRWRYCVECAVTEQWFAEEVTRFVDRLEPHKAFFADLTSTGGEGSCIIQFFGRYLSDTIPVATLAKLVDLGLSFSIECYFD